MYAPTANVSKSVRILAYWVHNDIDAKNYVEYPFIAMTSKANAVAIAKN